jgi:methionyl aminopeptidase
MLGKGLVITIEPFLTTGSAHVREADDGWTLLADPSAVTAQYEHTMVITNGAPLVMTLPTA